jgi:penicillin-binding protein 1B
MRRALRGLLAASFLVAIAAALVGVVRLDARVRAYLRGPALGGVRIYAAATHLRPGDPVDAASLRRRLARLGYVAVAQAPAHRGELHAAGDTIALRRHDGRDVRVQLARGTVQAITAPGADVGLDELVLPGELLAVEAGDHALLEAGLEAVPTACRDAVLAAEDRRFFQHVGVDPLAIARAVLANLRAGEARQGASTITQQLVKNTFLSPQRTVGRKLREAVLAVLLELRASKREILGRYLASVYLGSDGGLPVHGLGHGALVHFGTPLGELDLADCALLAGIIRAPNALDPRRHPDAARARRDEVLDLMRAKGRVTEADWTAARAKPLPRDVPRQRPVASLYVADEVRRRLVELFGEEAAHASGLVVHTTIDAEAQRAAEHAVRRRLDALDPDRRRGLEGALVALEPGSGRIRALVGGRDYRRSRLDHAVRARRQPGSTFKPFVYLAALDPTRTPAPMTLASTVDDSPVTVQLADGAWRPANHRGAYHGTVTLEDALTHSLNAATVRVAQEVGVGSIADAAHDLGIDTPLPAVPSLALGAGEVSLLELTSAYATIADGGVRHAPFLVDRIETADGSVVYRGAPQAGRVLGADVAYLLTHMLESVVARGTGAGVRAAGLRGPAAGKTGTTDAGRDAWFVGWTPDVIAGVWVGVERGPRGGLTGADAAVPIWAGFARAVARPSRATAFAAPPGLVWRDVDPSTGLIGTADCPARRAMPFLPGTEPMRSCPHGERRWAAVGRETGRAVESFGRRIGRWFGELFD